MDKQNIQPGALFGFWEIIELPPKGPLICKCTGCNSKIIHKIYLYRLVQGKTKSCGCQRAELIKTQVLEKYKVENISKSKEHLLKRQKTNLEIYGETCTLLNSEVKKKAKQTKLAKYSTENISSLDFVKAKKKETMQERYNVDHALQSSYFKEKCMQTLQKNFNTSNPAKNKDLLQKREETNKQRYGETTPLKNKIVREKIKKTNLEKYGFEVVTKNKEIREKIATTNLLKYGRVTSLPGPTIFLSNGQSLKEYCQSLNIDSSFAYRIYKEKGEEHLYSYCNSRGEPTNYLETLLVELLKDRFPDLKLYNRSPNEFQVNRKPDFRLEKDGKVLYVNLDGLYWHCELQKSRNYHLDYQTIFAKNNLNIFQFREHEIYSKPNIVKSIILNYLGLSETKYNARSLSIKVVDQVSARSFFDENHLMGYKQVSKVVGLFEKEELLAAMCFRRKKEGLEIVRFCSKINIIIRGGFSKLVNFIITNYKPKYIESFCDLRYSTGSSYISQNFQLVRTTLGFEWTDKITTYNRLQCRANMDDRKLSQDQHAKELGWYKIYDAGQALYRKEIL